MRIRLAAVFGLMLHRLLISRVTGVKVASLEGEGHYAQLILTLGLALILSNGGLLLFGSTPVSIKTSLSSSAWELGPLFGNDVSVFLNKARGIARVTTGQLKGLAITAGKRSPKIPDVPTLRRPGSPVFRSADGLVSWRPRARRVRSS